MLTNRLRTWLLILIFTLPLLSVADDLPELGDSAESAFSLQDEIRMGREIYRAMKDSGEIIDDIEINDYLNKLGRQLSNAARSSSLQFTYFAVNDSSINAFAMPGGYIGINRGLLLLTQNEGELASVIAHETAHVTQRHLARMRASGSRSQLYVLAGVVAAALAASSGNSDVAVGALQTGIGASISSQLSYSRSFEQEADRIGMQYMDFAGFDARAMPAFFTRMGNVHRFNDTNAFSFLRTHPLTSERISEAQNRAFHYSVRMKIDSVDYLLVREKLRVMAGESNDLIRYYKMALGNRQFLSEGAQYYGLARAYMKMRSWEQANQSLEEARKRLPRNSMILSTDAEIAKLRGDASVALGKYRSALAAYPQNKALIYGELDTLIDSNQNTAAITLLKKQISRFPGDPDLYRRQANLLSEKNPMQYHVSLGQAFYLEGRDAAALEQYQMANAAKGDDFYLRSSIEARIKELQTRLNQVRKTK